MTARATLGVLTPEAVALARRPKVVAAMLARLHLADGILRLHAGAGTIRLSGEEFAGVSDPGRARLCSIDAIEEPRAGVASYVRIGLAGVDREFVSYMREHRTEIEGLRCDLLVGLWDAATGDGVLTGVFERGSMTGAGFRWSEKGLREWSVTVVGAFAARNVAVDGRLTPADQQRRHAGDTALDLIGGSVAVRWPIAET